jgi:hypothetical protein
MRRQGVLGAGVTALFLAAVCVAADGPGKCPPYADGRTYDASPIVDAIDKNRDGKMTHEEWQTAEAPEASWSFFMAKENIKTQGFITRADFLAESPPNGIDTDCDGKITIDEFLATKKWQMGPPPGANAGPPPAPK